MCIFLLRMRPRRCQNVQEMCMTCIQNDLESFRLSSAPDWDSAEIRHVPFECRNLPRFAMTAPTLPLDGQSRDTPRASESQSPCARAEMQTGRAKTRGCDRSPYIFVLAPQYNYLITAEAEPGSLFASTRLGRNAPKSPNSRVLLSTYAYYLAP